MNCFARAWVGEEGPDGNTLTYWNIELELTSFNVAVLYLTTRKNAFYYGTKGGNCGGVLVRSPSSNYFELDAEYSLFMSDFVEYVSKDDFQMIVDSLFPETIPFYGTKRYLWAFDGAK